MLHMVHNRLIMKVNSSSRQLCTVAFVIDNFLIKLRNYALLVLNSVMNRTVPLKMANNDVDENEEATVTNLH